jgi:hypothetical protein
MLEEIRAIARADFFRKSGDKIIKTIVSAQPLILAIQEVENLE